MYAKTRLSAEVFAFCLLAAAALQIMDSLLPKIPIFPWLRLGLSHLIILPFILKFGSVNGCILLLARNLIALLYGGQMFTSFLISSISGILSIMIFAPILLYLYRKSIIGILGLNLVLAVSFNIFQLVNVNLFFIQNMSFFIQLAPLLAWSVLSGALAAYIVSRGDKWISQCFEVKAIEPPQDGSSRGIAPLLNTRTFFLAGLFIWILLIQNWQLQLLTFLLLMILLRGRHFYLVLYAWPFYFYLVWLHLLGTDGVYIISDWITREGWVSFRYFFIRTLNIIFCGKLISEYVISLNLSFSGSTLARGFSLTLPVLPGLFGIALQGSRESLGLLRQKKFSELFSPLIKRIQAELEKKS